MHAHLENLVNVRYKFAIIKKKNVESDIHTATKIWH